MIAAESGSQVSLLWRRFGLELLLFGGFGVSLASWSILVISFVLYMLPKNPM